MKYFYIILCLLFLGCSKDKDISPITESQDSEDFILEDWPGYRRDSGLNGYIEGFMPKSYKLEKQFNIGTEIYTTGVIQDDNIIFSCDDGSIRSISLLDEKQNWIFKTDSLFESSPLIIDNRLFIGNINGEFYKLNVLNGELLWKVNTGKISGSSNYSFTDNGKLNIFFGSYDTNLYNLDGSDGSINWTFKTQGYINGTPTIYKDSVIFGGCDTNLYVADIVSGESLNEVATGSYIPGSAVAYESTLYLSQYEGIFMSIDQVTGNTNWTYEDGGEPFAMIPAIYGDYVVVGSDSGNLYCLDRESGIENWKFLTGNSVDAPVLINKDYAVFGSLDGYLYLVDLKNGKELWSYDLGEAISGSPIYNSGRLVVSTIGGSVFIFSGDKK